MPIIKPSCDTPSKYCEMCLSSTSHPGNHPDFSSKTSKWTDNIWGPFQSEEIWLKNGIKPGKGQVYCT